MSYEIIKAWKVFNINMREADIGLLAAAPSYAGTMENSSELKLIFSSEPSQAEKDAIDAYWNGLTSSSSEALSYVSQIDYDAALQVVLDGFDFNKTYDQLNANEKKIIGNVNLGYARKMISRADLGL